MVSIVADARLIIERYEPCGAIAPRRGGALRDLRDGGAGKES
jgi:hypothetical protein